MDALISKSSRSGNARPDHDCILPEKMLSRPKQGRNDPDPTMVMYYINFIVTYTINYHCHIRYFFYGMIHLKTAKGHFRKSEKEKTQPRMYQISYGEYDCSFIKIRALVNIQEDRNSQSTSAKLTKNPTPIFYHKCVNY